VRGDEKTTEDARVTGRCRLCGAAGVHFRLTISQTGAHRQVIRRITESYICAACTHAIGGAMDAREKLREEMTR